MKTPRNPLIVVELREAEVTWVKYIQRQHFTQWILGLLGNKWRIVSKTYIDKLNTVHGGWHLTSPAWKASSSVSAYVSCFLIRNNCLF